MVVGEAVGDSVRGVGVQEAVLLQAGLIVGVLEVVRLPEDVVANLEGVFGVRTELFDHAGDVVAEDDGNAALVNIEAPVASVVLVRVHCGRS